MVAVRGTDAVDSGTSLLQTQVVSLSAAGAQAGDVAYIVASANVASQTQSVNRSGWAASTQQSQSTIALSARLFKKTLVAQDITDDTVTVTCASSNQRISAALLVLSGAGATETEVVASQTSADTSPPIGAIDPVNNSLVGVLMALNMAATAASVAPPANWTERDQSISTHGSGSRRSAVWIATFNTNPTSSAVSTVNATTDQASVSFAWTIIVNEGVVTGTVDGTCPSPTASVTGTVPTTGTVSGTIPALTASMTGSDPVAGAAGGTVPALTGGMTATSRVTGTVGGTCPALSAGMTGSTPNEADCNGVIPDLQGALSASVPSSGTLSGAFTPPTGSAAAQVPILGSVGGSTPLPSGQIEGDTPDIDPSATVSGVLPALTASLSASTPVEGELGGSIGAPAASVTASVAVLGATEGVTPQLLALIEAQVHIEGSISGAVPALTAQILVDDGEEGPEYVFVLWDGTLADAVEWNGSSLVPLDVLISD